jgi:nicotinamide-nucleotide amidase
MLSTDLLAHAEKLLADARAKGLKIATAESCTGGLIAGLLTEIAGSSDVFERGFVTYSNEAKQELLGVPRELLARYGAVSAEVARAMALGALKHAHADMAVAVTGIAGPTGGTMEKPVGLVYLAAARGERIIARECRFGETGRREVRLASVEVALELLTQLV